LSTRHILQGPTQAGEFADAQLLGPILGSDQGFDGRPVIEPRQIVPESLPLITEAIPSKLKKIRELIYFMIAERVSRFEPDDGAIHFRRGAE
jgi:hypothetical protein